MSGVAIKIDATGLTQRLAQLEGIAEAPLDELAEGTGRLVQEQTRRRIEEEKTTPDGAPWKPNRAGTSILYQSGALSRSVDYLAAPNQVQVGSGLIYASVHQKGKVIKPRNARALVFMMGNELVFARSVTIPAREWLGLSADNEDEIVSATEDWLGSLIQ